MTGSRPRRFVAISGDLGSGKSTVTKALASKLGWRSVSTGEMQRTIAASRNLTTLELNHLAEEDFSVDSAVDAALKAIGENDDEVVLDSRMAWWFVPNALSVHVTVRPDVGDSRLLGRTDQKTEQYSSPEQAQRHRAQRAQSERERFSSFYGVDIQRLRNYDVIVDSTSATPAEIVEHLSRQYGDARSREGLELWLSPLNLLPSEIVQTLRDLDDRAVELLSRAEFLVDHPIDVIYSYPYFQVVDGHKRLSAALKTGSTMIPARLVAEGSELVYGEMSADELFRRSLQLFRIYDWEDAHSIDYGLDRQRGYLPSA